MPKLWPVHYVLGLAGVALIRNWMVGGEEAKSCEAELTRLANAFAENPALQCSTFPTWRSRAVTNCGPTPTMTSTIR